MDDEEVDSQLQATPAPRKGKAARTLPAMLATCHSVQLHAKQLARGEGSVDNGPAVPGSYGVNIASGESASVIIHTQILVHGSMHSMQDWKTLWQPPSMMQRGIPSCSKRHGLVLTGPAGKQ